MALDRLVPELYSSNIDRTIAFYVGDLGFHILYQRPEEKFVYLERENSQIMFEQHGVGRNWITADLTPPYGRGVNFQIPVTDVFKLYDSLKEKGFSFFLPLEEKWYRRNDHFLGNRQFIMQDPDGYLLRMAQDLGSKSVQ